MDAFSARLRELRVKKEMQQKELAAVFNVSQGVMSGYENGREPPYETLIDISRYFAVSTDYLLGVSADRYPAGDAVTVALEKLAPVVIKAGAEPLPASDLAQLAARLLEYYRNGAPAGNAPLEALHVYLRTMDDLLSATLTGSAAQVLDAVNRAAASILDLHKVLDCFLSDKTD